MTTAGQESAPIDTAEEFGAWVDVHLIEPLSTSALSLTLATEQPDWKVMLETGASIWLDKPLVLVAPPSMHIPAKLRLVADRIIEADVRDPAQRERVAVELQDALRTIVPTA